MATPLSEIIDFVQREIRADRKNGRRLFLALSPLDAQKLGEVKINGLCKTIWCDRPAARPILDALEQTAETHGIDLQLDSSTRTWLTKIAESQNIPGPLSTIGSRLVRSKIIAKYAQPAAPLEFGGDLGAARYYEQSTRLAQRLSPAWGEALNCSVTDELQYKIQAQRSKEKIRSANTQLTVMCGWPGNGRLAFAQKIWLASANARERFGYVDLCDRASQSRYFSDAKREALRKLLRNKLTTVYLDLTSYSGTDSSTNDAVVSGLDSGYPLDLLWISGAVAQSALGKRWLGQPSHVTPTWVQLQDIPRAAGPSENHYGESLAIAELFRSWGLPGDDDTMRLDSFSRVEPADRAATGNLRVLVASDINRVKAFVDSLASHTGRSVLQIGLPDKAVDTNAVRKFVLQHRTGIILISDLLRAPLEMLHTADPNDGLSLQISNEQIDCGFTRRINDFSLSNIWSPGIEPVLDSHQLAGLWVFGMLPLPHSFSADEVWIDATDGIDVESLINIFPGSAQGRVRTLFKHWNHFQYLPTHGELIHSYAKVEYTGGTPAVPAVPDLMHQSTFRDIRR